MDSQSRERKHNIIKAYVSPAGLRKIRPNAHIKQKLTTEDQFQRQHDHQMSARSNADMVSLKASKLSVSNLSAFDFPDFSLFPEILLNKESKSKERSASKTRTDTLYVCSEN